MRKKNRRIVFYLLAALFFLAAPLLLAYSVGYRFDFSEGVFEKTGGIFVKSKVPRLSIFLNGAFIKETSFISGGALLPEIKPGTHLLRIEKAGWHPWSKTVAVESTMVTELRDLILVPNPIFSATSTRSELAILLHNDRTATTSVKLSKSTLVQKIGTTTVAFADDVDSFSQQGNVVFFINRSGFLAELNLDDGAIRTIGRPGFYLDGKPMRFIGSGRGHVAIVDSSGGLYIVNPAKTVSPVTGGVKEIFFDEEGRKAILIKENSIELLWLGPNERQPFQKEGMLENIISINARITEAAWYFEDNAHVFLTTADGLFFTEIDGRGGRNTIELVPGRVEEIKTTPEFPGTVFYRKGKLWFKIEI